MNETIRDSIRDSKIKNLLIYYRRLINEAFFASAKNVVVILEGLLQLKKSSA